MDSKGQELNIGILVAETNILIINYWYYKDRTASVDLGSHLKGEITYCFSHQRVESCVSEETEEGQRNIRNTVQEIQLSWPYPKSWQTLDKGVCGRGVTYRKTSSAWSQAGNQETRASCVVSRSHATLLGLDLK